MVPLCPQGAWSGLVEQNIVASPRRPDPLSALTFLLLRLWTSELRKEAGAEDGHQGELSHLLLVRWSIRGDRRNEVLRLPQDQPTSPGTQRSSGLPVRVMMKMMMETTAEDAAEVESVPEEETKNP